MKEVTDWKGNVIKEGDEVCIIKIRTGGFVKNGAVMIPHGDGTFTEYKIPDEPEEDCWIVGDYIKIEKGLKYITKAGDFTFENPIVMLEWIDKKHILAIKGVSDTK